MMNRFNVSRIKKYATRELLAKDGCEHAVYGISYKDELGCVIERFASTPNEIKYFYSDDEFQEYVLSIEDELLSSEFNVYVVHKVSVKEPEAELQKT